jgi:hypothetical protein
MHYDEVLIDVEEKMQKSETRPETGKLGSFIPAHGASKHERISMCLLAFNPNNHDVPLVKTSISGLPSQTRRIKRHQGVFKLKCAVKLGP